MACGMKPLVVVIALSWVLSVQQHSSSVHGKPQVPCFFIFGDSLADNGNNNLLDTLAKVNYKPYGIDFSGGVTGRFSNGRTTVDVLCMHLFSLPASFSILRTISINLSFRGLVVL